MTSEQLRTIQQAVKLKYLAACAGFSYDTLKSRLHRGQDVPEIDEAFTDLVKMINAHSHAPPESESHGSPSDT